jgi:heme/copper-type cytochrome/quinol oxidase subunit 2
MNLDQKINSILAISLITLLAIFVGITFLAKLSQEAEKSNSSPRDQYEDDLTNLYKTL